MLRDQDCTHSKSLLYIFYINLFCMPNTQATPPLPSPLFQTILEKKKKKNVQKATSFTTTFSFVCLPDKAWQLSKIQKVISERSPALFFCAVDTFLIQLRCCLYFGGPLAASKTKQSSGILFQEDREVSSQDKGKRSQYCICKAESIISWQGIGSLFQDPEISVYVRHKEQRMWRELAIEQAQADSAKMFSILTPVLVVNPHINH